MLNLKLYGVIAVLVLAILGLGYGLSLSRDALTATQAQVAALSSQVDELAAHQRRIQTQVSAAQKAAQENTHALATAIDLDRDDAAQRTPAAVVDSLCGFLRCPDPARRVSAPTR